MSEATRNLVIVYMPEYQARSDWEAVKERIEARAPDIAVRIVDNTVPDPETEAWQVTRPSLVFSVTPLFSYRPRGGAILAGGSINKIAQARRLAAAGLPGPETRLLTPGLELDPDAFGEYAVVKPLDEGGSMGRHVKLVRTDGVVARYMELTLRETIPMVVQQYVDAVDGEGRPFEYRLLTVFGRPLYLLKVQALDSRRPLSEIVAAGGEIAVNRRGVKRELSLVIEDDIVTLGAQVAEVFPDRPCLGIDFVRVRESGALQVIETNPAGGIWHLSSQFTPNYPEHVRNGLYEQFQAIETIAEILIDRTRSTGS
jgi:hypothetical protein